MSQHITDDSYRIYNQLVRALMVVYVPPIIVLPIQQVGIISLPAGYKGNYGSYNSLSM